MRKYFCDRIIICLIFCLIIIATIFTLYSVRVDAGSYDGHDLAVAILANESTLIDSSYSDHDQEGHRQAKVFTSLGILSPTDGSTFALFSTGIAGNIPVTVDGLNPGDERGSWFRNRHGHPRDWSTLTVTLNVPDGMHYLFYDLQFLTSEFPEYVGTRYNDRLIVTVDSPLRYLSIMDSYSVHGIVFLNGVLANFFKRFNTL